MSLFKRAATVILCVIMLCSCAAVFAIDTGSAVSGDNNTAVSGDNNTAVSGSSTVDGPDSKEGDDVHISVNGVFVMDPEKAEYVKGSKKDLVFTADLSEIYAPPVLESESAEPLLSVSTSGYYPSIDLSEDDLKPVDFQQTDYKIEVEPEKEPTYFVPAFDLGDYLGETILDWFGYAEFYVPNGTTVNYGGGMEGPGYDTVFLTEGDDFSLELNGSAAEIKFTMFGDFLEKYPASEETYNVALYFFEPAMSKAASDPSAAIAFITITEPEETVPETGDVSCSGIYALAAVMSALGITAVLMKRNRLYVK